MTRRISAVLALLSSGHLFAEEVLSSRPVVIAPKRIETETKLPAKSGKRNAPAARPEKESPPEKEAPSLQDSSVVIDEKNILTKVSFRPGSIQLSRPIRKQLIALGIKPGQKIRITGFGNGKGRNSVRLANLRARVVASFLTEAIGEIDAQLQWSGTPHTAHPEGALIEKVNP